MAKQILNFNIGVLGHVDSGKTSLSKILSTVESTASFDKNPQSKERGITLDLGFSSFCVDAPAHLQPSGFEQLQFTLVDCPGHASLIKTIIGGAQIIDLMILVIDIVEGVQTQTAECLIIGEIVCDKLVVVLNKIDLISSDKQQSAIDKTTKKLLKTLETTKFAGCPIVPVAAKPGGPDAGDVPAIGIDRLIDTLKTFAFVPQRDTTGHLVFAADHCFSIRGQGTVMTGTVLSGSIHVNDTVEIPSLKVTKKVKSMQMFHKPVNTAAQGDRVGICVTQFDPKLLERGLVCTPNSLPTVRAALVSAHVIPHFKSSINTKSKFHISVLHETVMARLTVFGDYSSDNLFSFDKEYSFQDELIKPTKSLDEEEKAKLPNNQFILLEFEHPVICKPDSLLIASRLDTDIHARTCRLAFYGNILVPFTDENYSKTLLPKLKVYKNKSKEGVVERKADEYSVICRGMFKKESNIEVFQGLKVTLSTGEQGVIEGNFGQSGKFKVRIPDGLKDTTSQLLADKSKKKGKAKDDSAAQSDPSSTQTVLLHLQFKRYIFDAAKKIIQV